MDGRSTIRLRSIPLENFRAALNSARIEDVELVMKLYPSLAKAQLLKPYDTAEIARTLHYRMRTNRRRLNESLKSDIIMFVSDLKGRRLPPHPLASLHLLSVFKESKQYDNGIEFWSWVSSQDDNYVNMATYGAGIELLAAYGGSLEECEALFTYALKRFAMNFNEYHLSHGAIVTDPEKPTILPGTSMSLLQGIMTARLAHGDSRNAYMALDTALRLHPTQTPVRMFECFLYERPLYEAFQIFQIFCRSGVAPSQMAFNVLLSSMQDTQQVETNTPSNSVMVRGMIAAYRYYLQSGGQIATGFQSSHIATLMHGCLRLLPRLSEIDLDDELLMSSFETTLEDFLGRTLPLYGSLNASPQTSAFNIMITAAARLRYHRLADFAMAAMSAAGLKPDRVTYRCLLSAAANSGHASEVEKAWQNLKQYQQSNEGLEIHDWIALVRAVVASDNVELLLAEMQNAGIVSAQSQELPTLSEDLIGKAKTSYMYFKITDMLKFEQQRNHARQVTPRDQSNMQILEMAKEVVPSLDGLQRYIEDRAKGSDPQDTKDTPSELTWPVSNKEWQRKLYIDLNSSATTMNASSMSKDVQTSSPELSDYAELQPGKLIENAPAPSQNPIPAQNMSLNEQSASTDLPFPSSESSSEHPPTTNTTGIPLDELRFRNWKTINNLLVQAELFDKRQNAAIEKALTEGRTPELGKFKKQLSTYPKKPSFMVQEMKAHVDDIAEAKRAPLTEEEWRATILRLRRDEYSWDSTSDGEGTDEEDDENP